MFGIPALTVASAGAQATPTNASPVSDEASFPVTLTGCQGEPVTFDAPPTRVVTMDAFAADTMIALGLQDRIVGTGFPHAVVPEDARDAFAAIPVLSELVMSREIIAEARPDLVLSVFPELLNGDRGAPTPADLAALGAAAFASCHQATRAPVTDLAATYTFVHDVGRIFGAPDRAGALVSRLREQEEGIRQRVLGLEAVRVLALFNAPAAGQPVQTWGTASLPNGLITLAGGANLVTDVAQHFAPISYEKVVARDPEVIWIVTDFGAASAEALIAGIRDNPLLATTSAVTQDRFAVVSHVKSGGPSPRNIEALVTLTSALHPEVS